MDRLITGESSDPLVVVLFLNNDKKMKSNMCWNQDKDQDKGEGKTAFVGNI